MRRVLIFIFFVLTRNGFSQELPRQENLIDISAGGGSYRGTLTLSGIHNWNLGEHHRFTIGTGIRYTGFLGANLYYITAPAKLTSESTSPLILFKENVSANIDSFLIKSPQVNSLNVLINLGYHITTKIDLGFNIDATGVSFGKKVKGNYINGYQGKITTAKPTPFNILLVSDNDRGSLNSELYARYNMTKSFALKVAIQFLFTEYTTETNVQQAPKENDRFRNKALLLSVGTTFKL